MFQADRTSTTRRSFLAAGVAASTTVAGAGAALATATLSASPHADAELLALGHEFGLAADKHTLAAASPNVSDEVLDELMDQVQRLTLQIAAVKVHTVEGLQVKARAVRFWHDGEIEVWPKGDPCDYLAYGIVRDLLDVRVA